MTAAVARSAVMAALAIGRGSKLASLLEELGYAATASETTADKIVKYACDSSDPGGVAAALGVIVRASEGHALSDRAEALSSAIGGLSLSDVAQAWNVDALVTAVKGAAPALDWNSVAAALDQPGFLVRDQGAFQLLVSAFRCGGLDGLPLPAVSNPQAHHFARTQTLFECQERCKYVPCDVHVSMDMCGLLWSLSFLNDPARLLAYHEHPLVAPRHALRAGAQPSVDKHRGSAVYLAASGGSPT